MRRGTLAGSLFTSNAIQNIAVPGDTVTFSFSDPPKSATDVVVSVLETIDYLDGTARVEQRFIGGFHGRFDNRVFRADRTGGAPPPPEPDPVSIRVAASMVSGAPALWAYMPEAHLVLNHTLQLRVTGMIDGRAERFDGKAVVHLDYPMALVVPQHGATHDPSLNVVESWAGQWQAFRPTARRVFHTRVLRLSRKAKPSDYDDLIQQLRAAADWATSGVVALAVGHGDAGGVPEPDPVTGETKTTIAWCNFVPEDWPPAHDQIPNRYQLSINEMLLANAVPPALLDALNAVERVKLNALDRIADELAAARARRLIIHTCNAGNNEAFMQNLANRLGVSVLGQKQTIAFTGAPQSQHIACHYEGDAPRAPRDEQQVPVGRLSSPYRPGTRPSKVPL